MWVAARSFRATSARSRLWKKRFVLRVKRRVRKVKMDFPLNRRAKLPHCYRFGSRILEDCSGVAMLGEALPQGSLLVVRWPFQRLPEVSAATAFAGHQGSIQMAITHTERIGTAPYILLRSGRAFSEQWLYHCSIRLGTVRAAVNF
jgi:hypothetical protein